MNRVFNPIGLSTVILLLGSPAFGQVVLSNLDSCADAGMDLLSGDGAWSYDNSGATTGAEGQMEALCYKFGTSGIDQDVWMTWAPTVTGIVTMDTCGGPQVADTKIAAYPVSGCPIDGSAIDCNDDTCGLRSEISFNVDCGEVYTIQIGSFPGGASGSEVLTATQVGTPCPPSGTRMRVCIPVNNTPASPCTLEVDICGGGAVTCPTVTTGPAPITPISTPVNGTIRIDWLTCPVPPGPICIDFDVTTTPASSCGGGWSDPTGPVRNLVGVSFISLLRLGVNYCSPAIPNSTGQPGTIEAHGSAVAADNNVTLTAKNLPPGQFGFFLVSQTQGFFNPPGSQGNICLGSNIGRYNGATQVGQGTCFGLNLDLTSLPVNPPQAVLAGDTWNFQCWYRDNNPAVTSNFTDAVSILFQ